MQKLSSIDIHLLPALKDNYIAIARDNVAEKIAVIDPSEAKPILDFLNSRGWRCDLILNTHHHWDHTGGNLALLEEFHCPLIASEIDGEKIQGVTKRLKDGETFSFGTDVVRGIHIPGHTLGHMAFYFEKSKVVFAGDTLFSLGCGRLFEGTPEQMWTSLKKLRELPDETKLYCGHEYTESNARFARTIEPGNQDIIDRQEEVRKARLMGLPSLPSTIGMEKNTNPFLRADLVEVRSRLDIVDTSATAVFTKLRKMKDSF